MYKWQSLTMGNIVENFGDVLKQVWESLTKYHTLDIIWKYDKDAVGLPTFIYVATTHIDKEWDRFDDCLKEEAISDYLSNSYGYCHKGFTYKEAKGVVHITNIEWDEEE